MRRLGLVVLALGLFFALAVSADAAFPGRNGRIVFTERGILGVWPDGSGRKLFIRSGRDPAFSPNGRRIAFTDEFEFSIRNVGTTVVTRILVADANGRGRRRLTTGSTPDWSPDGRRLVFGRGHPCGKYEDLETDCPRRVQRSRNYGIMVYRRGRTRVLTRTGSDPAWSPDGRLIAFIRDGDLFVMRPDGSGARRIAESRNSSVSSLDWSPNGRRLVFGDTVSNVSEFRTEIATVRRDGGGYRVIRNGSQPTYSPNGRLIAFGPARPTSPKVCLIGAPLWIMRSDGTNAHPLRNRAGGRICGDIEDWQPLR
jgi:Tol biopolymer transport system component